MGKLIIIAAILFAAFKYMGELGARSNMTDEKAGLTLRVEQPKKLISSKKPAPMVMNFRCDGRQYCSQMTSRAEAEYFLAHCPDTRMDGDDDGIPCENDSRF
ncbi:hypothetical protein FX988_00781 [Paraglaciecola mesophila]|uniref:Excalibur calcium-binding domain-containing protein n=1 Tax=Paraglaciecola mesophila TaxID=197222 RepID=A0A857JHZ7_9ALTE|nr:excalibur calcium-binding domain-containing protein [Paraglaciecola mesophila]QHJ10567.1 hypothetical protein FX988_00781 [Paraglaciecola mesophila]